MKLSIYTLFYAAAVAYGQALEKQVRLDISADPTTVTGSPIEIKITMVNNSRDDIDVGSVVYKMNDGNSLYDLNVRDSLDRRVPKKEYPHLELSSASAYVRTLKPGETLADAVTVNRIYEMSQPGTYSVQVRTVLPKKNGGAEILSNTVRVNVRANDIRAASQFAAFFNQVKKAERDPDHQAQILNAVPLDFSSMKASEEIPAILEALRSGDPLVMEKAVMGASELYRRLSGVGRAQQNRYRDKDCVSTGGGRSHLSFR